MRILLFIAPVLLAVACMTVVKSTDDSAATRSEIAHRKVSEGATLLDVRTPEEFAAGHANGAINIPVQVLASRLSEIPKDREVVVYCHSGRRSGQAAEILTNAGYRVYDLKRFSDW